MRGSWPILIATFTLVLGAALAAASPAAATGMMVQPGGPDGRTATSPQDGPAMSAAQAVVSSTNWSGYAATGASGQFTSVSSSWMEPTAQCSGYGDQYSAFWVGLDGYSSSTVEQTGSEADCAGRTAEYSAWYEMYPAYPVYFSNRVRPGDNFTGSVTYQKSTGDFVITLTDSTQKWTQTASQAAGGAARNSAEFIAEAPSSGTSGAVLPLTNFGTVNFSGAKVNGGQLCQTSPVEILMPSASVSSISGCTNFSVRYTGGGGGGWPYF
jgi:Peptidase A4 family